MNAPEINISLRSIDERRSLSIMNRWEIFRHPADEPIDIDISVKFLPAADSCLIVRLGVSYTSVRSLVRRPLLKYVVDAAFEVSDLDKIVEADDCGIILPRELTVTLMSVTLGAVRGMLALRTSGTFLAEHPLPLYDLRELVRRISPRA